MRTKELVLEEQKKSLLYKNVLTSLHNINYICKKQGKI